MANPSRHAIRVREVWDHRLVLSERELLCELARLSLDRAENDWKSLTDDDTRRLSVALRTLVQLGREAEYALGYSQAKDRSKRGNANGQG